MTNASGEGRWPTLDFKPLIDDYFHKGLAAKENANMSTMGPAGLLLVVGGAALRVDYLHRLREEGFGELVDLHESGRIHIHDLTLGYKTPYCAGHSLQNLLNDGISAGAIKSGPAKRLRSAVNHIINYIGASSNEFAGAQAFNDVDLFLGPYACDYYMHILATYKSVSEEDARAMVLDEVMQSTQEMIFHLNYNTRYGGQCVTPDTECLTPKGWKTHEELCVGDEIFVVDTETGEMRTDTLTHVNVYDFSGNLLRFKGRCADILVTPNHRMVYRKSNVDGKLGVLEAAELAERAVINIPNTAALNRPDNPAWSDDRVRMLAWVLSDAHMETGRYSRIRIYQTEKKFAEEIRALLSRLGIAYTESEDIGEWGSEVVMFEIHGGAAREWIAITGGERNRIPASAFDTFSARQAKLFLDEYIKADGHIEANGRTRISKKYETMIDDLQHMAVLAGIGTTLTRRAPGGTSTAHAVALLKRNVVSATEVTPFSYTGKVWCPTTATGTFVARRNNKVFITGNSPFSNISLALDVPSDMAKQRPLIGGKTLEERWSRPVPGHDAETAATYESLAFWQQMIAEAILDNFMRGDIEGKGFTFPVLSINAVPELFSHPLKDKVFALSARFGNPYYQNYVNGYSGDHKLDPSDVRSMCCRLQIDQNMIRKHTGGAFGNGDQTGSIIVITQNYPMIAMDAYKPGMSPDEAYEAFIAELSRIGELIKEMELWKRKVVTQSWKEGFFPMAQTNLRRGFDTFYTTLGFVGLWEAIEVITGSDESFMTDTGLEYAQKVLKHARNMAAQWSEETHTLFNFEATPAESAAYKLCLKMLKVYPDAPHRGTPETPYLTNSCHIPVEYNDDVPALLHTQGVLQPIISGGTVVHLHTGEKLTVEGVEAMVRTMCETRIPFFSVSPVYSRCACCGRIIPGDHEFCPYEHTDEQIEALRKTKPWLLAE